MWKLYRVRENKLNIRKSREATFYNFLMNTESDDNDSSLLSNDDEPYHTMTFSIVDESQER